VSAGPTSTGGGRASGRHAGRSGGRAHDAPARHAALLFASGCALLLAGAAGCGLLGRGGGGDGREGVYGAPRPPEWYASNAPLMVDYLDTLPDSRIGEPLQGILLSDGERWLEGLVYLGDPVVPLPEGVNARLVDDGERAIAYLWLDAGAEPFTLSPCPDGPQRGIRAQRAGGAPYAWKALRPEHGLVYTLCPPATWLPADRPSARPAPGGA